MIFTTINRGLLDHGRRLKALGALLLFYSVVPGSWASAQSLPIDAISGYELKLTSALRVAEVSLQPVSAQVDFIPSQATQLNNVFDQATINYQVVDGQAINVGDVIAEVDGPAVTHFYLRLSILESEYQLMTRQHKENTALFADQLLASDAYQQFLHEYRLLTDEFQEAHTQADWFSRINGTQLRVVSRLKGIWRLENNDLSLGQIYPLDTLSIMVKMPVSLAADISSIRSNGNDYAISYRDNSVKNGLVSLYAKLGDGPLPAIGRRMQVTPIISAENGFSYQVPGSAITSLEGSPVVIAASKQHYTSIPVEVIQVTGQHYVISTEQPLLEPIVTHSVSVLQTAFSDEAAE